MMESRSKRDEYVEKIKNQLDEWNKEIEALEEKAHLATGDIKSKYEERIASLRQHHNDAKEKAEEIRKAADDAWDELKEGFENAWQTVREAFKNSKD
jgi:chromosome segregation ATPase